MPILESTQEINPKLLLNTRRYLFLTVILVLGGVALIGFAIKPQIETILESSRNISKERQYFDSLTQKLTELKQIEFSAEFEQKDRVDEVLPSYKPVLEILFNLSQASQQNEITVQELEFSPGKLATESAETTSAQTTATKKDLGYLPLQLNITVAGEGEDMDEFLAIIERIAPFTTITELNMKEDRQSNAGQTQRQQTEDGEKSAEMTIETYYYVNTITTSIDASLPSVGEEQMDVFETIQKFRPTEFEKPTQIKSDDVEDLFGIEGFDLGGEL